MLNNCFYYTRSPDPHKARRKRIRMNHPEITRLYGHNKYSALLVVGLVLVQFLLAWMLSMQPLWLVFLVSYCMGAYLSAALYALIHEASHKLIFKSAGHNKWVALVANLPLVVVGAVPFFRYHLAHHSRFNDYHQDVGVPTKKEAKWVGNNAFKKMLWLAFFPVFQWQRAAKYETKKTFVDPWMITNIIIQLIANLLVLWFLGLQSFIYLLLSFSWSFGLHPLGTRVVQEHFIVKPGQETNNFTGVTKVLECNFGLHAEHHDFPAVPWNKLPEISKLAPEEYVEIHKFHSRLVLLVDFICNPAWSLHSNTVRTQTTV